jgi:transposase InsO family protein
MSKLFSGKRSTEGGVRSQTVHPITTTSNEKIPEINIVEHYNYFKTHMRHIVDLDKENRPFIKVELLGYSIIGLLDSGATCTILGRESEKLIKSLGLEMSNETVKVSTADGTNHTVKGSVNMPYLFNKKTIVIPTLVVPSLSKKLILGCDFWKAFGLCVTMLEELNVVESFEIEQCEQKENYSDSHVLTFEQSKKLESIKTLFIPARDGFLSGTKAIRHYIDTGDVRPIRTSAHVWSPYIQKEIDTELKRMLDLGVIQPSKSSWAFPLVPVRKSNGKLRLCLDSRKLNEVTKRDNYPIPHMGRITKRLEKSEYFSAIDMSDAFWQVELEESSREKCAFIVHGKGLFEHVRMPFGLVNSPMTMARLMDQVLKTDLEPFVFCYMDDIIVATKTFEQHMELLTEVAHRMSAAGLAINLTKSFFCKKQIKYLGLIMNKDGYRADPLKIEAIMNYQPPKTIRQNRRFMGMVNFYKDFIQDFATIAAPITDLLSTKRKFVWTEKADEAFRLLKTKLVSRPILSNPNFDLPFFLHTDASDFGLGGVLMQNESTDSKDLGTKVIAYFSQKLTSTQKNYAATERECLAVLLAVERYRGYLEGTHFTVVVDCSAITWLKNLKFTGNSRLARWAMKLDSYDMTIIHKPGKSNVVADFLSRSMETMDLTTTSEWYLDLKRKILEDKSKYPMFQVIDEKVFKKVGVFEDDSSENTYDWKLVVPPDKKLAILKQEHDNAAHLGIGKTTDRIRLRYYWPKMASEIQEYVNNCEICKASKTTTQNLTPPMGKMKQADGPWQLISADYIGPFVRSKKRNQYLLVIVDWFSKGIVLRPVQKAESKSLTKIIENDIFLDKCVPEILISDNGKQFISKEFTNLLKHYNVTHFKNCYHHPQSNFCERSNKVINAAIRSYIKGDHKEWDAEIKNIELAINTSKSDSTKFTPYFINHGREYIFDGREHRFRRELRDNGKQNQSENSLSNFLENQDKILGITYGKVKKNIENAYNKYSHNYNLRSKPQNHKVNDIVWKKNFALSNASENFSAKLAPKYIKCRITAEKGPNSYELADMNGKSVGIFHVSDFHK